MFVCYCFYSANNGKLILLHWKYSQITALWCGQEGYSMKDIGKTLVQYK